MNDTTKKRLKIIGIYYGVNFILSFLWCCVIAGGELTPPNAKDILNILLWSFSMPIILLVVSCIIFVPAIITLYFLFKKIQCIKYRIILTAFIIPFNNLVYLFIEHFYFRSEIISSFIGFYALFIILPIIFITTLCIPKSLLKFKWEIINTNILTYIFGWGLIILGGNIMSILDTIIEIPNLKKYEPLIQNIEKYKTQNGTYPQKVEDNVKYCSNNKIDDCYPLETDYSSFEKVWKWIKRIELD